MEEKTEFNPRYKIVRELNVQTIKSFMFWVSQDYRWSKITCLFNTQIKHERLKKLNTLIKNPSSHSVYYEDKMPAI